MSAIDNNDLKEWAIEDSAGNVSSNTRLRVVKANYDYNITQLYHSIHSEKNIDLTPDFQRRSRWDNKKKSRLIESLLMGIPIPSIFMFENDFYQYEVIDGKQRLESIVSFINNEFKLTGLEFWNHFNNHFYRDLPDQIERSLLRQTISTTVLLAESETTSLEGSDIRMILFDRLNTGGVKLNYQEIRNAVYAGPFNSLLYELSSNELFRRLWRLPLNEEELKKNVIYSSLTDCELVLRYFTIRDTIVQSLKGSLKSLQDHTMKTYKNITAETAAAFKDDYLSALSFFYDTLGDSAFILPGTGKVARNLYDSFMVGHTLISDHTSLQDGEIIRKNIDITLSNPQEYDIIITKGNSIDAIEHRVKKAKEILTQNLSL